MRDRLIELLLKTEKEADKKGFCNCHSSRPKAEYVADYLLENGVVVLPCKVGDTIYMLVTRKTHSFEHENGKMIRLENQHAFIKKTHLMESNFFRVLRDFGKTVFLTREEAERALEEGE